MSISTAMNISMGGMRAQSARAAAIADNVANVNTPGYVRAETRIETQPPAGVRATVSRANAAWPDRSDVDLAAEILDLTETQIAFKANAVVFDTGADMWEMLESALDGKRR